MIKSFKVYLESYYQCVTRKTQACRETLSTASEEDFHAAYG
jgi:NADPH-dependent 7-cyano-7-deazaguanine reductase QueF-like protein